MKNILFYILLVMAMGFWGASWAASKVLIEYASADVVAFWRFFFALLASCAIVFFLKIPLRIDKSALKFLSFCSFFELFVFYYVFYRFKLWQRGKKWSACNNINSDICLSFDFRVL